MDSLKSIAIKEYLGKIDFKNDNWSINQISKDMQKFLGEIPGVDIVYKKDVMVNEVTGESKEIKSINKVDIVFTDTDDKIKKLSILI
jgi:threonine aldolase